MRFYYYTASKRKRKHEQMQSWGSRLQIGAIIIMITTMIILIYILFDHLLFSHSQEIEQQACSFVMFLAF